MGGGDDISVLEFKGTESGRDKKVIANVSIADEIRAIGIRRSMKLTKMSQHSIENLLRGEAVKRKTHEHLLKHYTPACDRKARNQAWLLKQLLRPKFAKLR